MKTLRTFMLASLALVGIVMAWRAAEPYVAPKLWSGEGVTKEAAAQIKEGMSEMEVGRLFGCPAGDYSQGKQPLGERFAQAGQNRYTARCWRNDEITVHVFFSDRTGRAASNRVEKTE